MIYLGTYNFFVAQVIIPCCIDRHFVVCRVNLLAGHIVCYDPLAHNVDAQEAVDRRTDQLAPLLCMIPAMLRQSGWYFNTPHTEAHNHWRNFGFDLLFAPAEERFIQYDDKSCGVFTAMMVERLISGSPNSQDWASKNIQTYRKKMACSIFELCKLVCD